MVIFIYAHTHRPTDTLRGIPGAEIGQGTYAQRERERERERERQRERERYFFPNPPQLL